MSHLRFLAYAILTVAISTVALPAHASLPCVNGVEAQFATLAPSPAKISLWYRTLDGIDTEPPFPEVLIRDEARRVGPFVLPPTHALGDGGVQGVQRFAIDGIPHVAYTADSSYPGSPWQAHLFIARLGSKVGFGSSPIDTNRSSGPHSVARDDRNLVHLVLNQGGSPFREARPGGFQVVDDLAFIPVFDAGDNGRETRLFVVDLSVPEQPRMVAGAPLLLPEVRRGAAVGALSLGDGLYLLAVRGHRRDGPYRRYLSFYSLQLGQAPQHLSTLQDPHPFAEQGGFDDYQGISLLRDCDTGAVYLVGFDDDEDSECGGGVHGGRSYADLFRVDEPHSRTPRLARIGQRSFGDLTGAGCAGAGTYVDDHGALSAYLMKNLGAPEDERGPGVVKMFEFASSATQRSGITVHEDSNFKSKRRRFVGDVWNLSEYELNDEIGSIEVHSGEWEICTDRGYVDCRRVSSSIARLRDLGLNNRLSSIRKVTQQNPRLMGDVNGDGRADAVMFGDREVYVALGRADGRLSAPRPTLRNFTYNSGGWRVQYHPRALGDVNGDGRSDVVGFGSWRVYVALGRADGTFAPPRATIQGFTYYGGGWRTDKHPRLLGDVNGDGRSDIVGFGGGNVIVALGRSDGTFTSARASIPNFSYARGWRIDRHPRLLRDVNGDGRVDIVGFGNSSVFVALGRFDGTFAPARAALNDFTFDRGWRVDRHPRLLGDVNGDGRGDIVAFGSSQVLVALGRSDGTFSSARTGVYGFSEAQGWRVDQHRRLLTDVDGNGKDDIVGFGANTVFVATASWNGAFSPTRAVFSNLAWAQGWRNDRHPRLAADIDGDGSSDIVGFGGRDVLVARGNSLGDLAAATPVIFNLLP